MLSEVSDLGTWKWIKSILSLSKKIKHFVYPQFKKIILFIIHTTPKNILN